MSKPKTGGVIEVILFPDAKPRDTSKRPWAKRARELDEREGAYADLAAWAEWIEEPMHQFDCSVEFIEQCQHETALYVLMCDLADGSGEDG